MNGFERFLATVLNPGDRFSAGGGTRLAAAAEPSGPAPMLARAGSDDQQLGVFPTAPQMQPQQTPPVSNVPAGGGAPPSPAPSPRQPRQRAGGGFGDFVGSIFAPRRTARNQTVEWLQGQGMDEGTATLMAGNKQALQQYLLDRSQGSRPEYDFMNVDGTLVRTDARTGQAVPVGQFGQDGNDFDEYGFPKTGAISQKIRAYKMQGYDDQQAIGLATGRYSPSLNPQTGERVLIDVADQRIIPLQQPDRGAQGRAETRGGSGGGGRESLYEIAPLATGIGTSVRELSSSTAGQLPGAVGEAMTAEETSSAVSRFDLFRRNIIQSLALNPRFPIAEQRTLENLVPHGTFTSGEQLRTRLTELDRYLTGLERHLAGQIDNPSTPVDKRNDYSSQLSAIRQARSQIGAPQGGGASGNGAALPEGVTEEDLQFTMEKHGLSREEVLERLNAR